MRFLTGPQQIDAVALPCAKRLAVTRTQHAVDVGVQQRGQGMMKVGRLYICCLCICLLCLCLMLAPCMQPCLGPQTTLLLCSNRLSAVAVRAVCSWLRHFTLFTAVHLADAIWCAIRNSHMQAFSAPVESSSRPHTVDLST